MRVKVSTRQREAILGSMQEIAMICDTLTQARTHQTTIMGLIAEANGFDPETQQVQFDPVTGEMFLAPAKLGAVTPDTMQPPAPIGPVRPAALGAD